MNKELEVFLVKLQTTLGSVEGTLTGADNYFPALPDSKIDIAPAFQEIETMSGGYDQDASVRGLISASANLSCWMRSKGTTTAPDFGLLAQIAGMKQTTTTVGGGYKYHYAPSSDLVAKDATVWHYSGGAGASASLLRKIGNLMGDWKISAETRKPCKFELTGGKAVYTSEAAGTLPTPTKDRSIIPATTPITVLIGGVAYNVLKFSFDGNNSVEQNISCTATYGYGNTEITKKKGKFSFTAYANAALTLPMSTVIAGAVLGSSLALTWGPGSATTDRTIKIECLYPQFTDCKQGESGGLTVWDVSGIFTRNDITITANSGLTT